MGLCLLPYSAIFIITCIYSTSNVRPQPWDLSDLQARGSTKLDICSVMWEHNGNLSSAGLWHMHLNWYRLTLIYPQMRNENSSENTYFEFLSVFTRLLLQKLLSFQLELPLWRLRYNVWSFVHLVISHSTSFLLCKEMVKCLDPSQLKWGFPYASGPLPSFSEVLYNAPFSLETHRLSASGFQSWPALSVRFSHDS